MSLACRHDAFQDLAKDMYLGSLTRRKVGKVGYKLWRTCEKSYHLEAFRYILQTNPE